MKTTLPLVLLAAGVTLLVGSGCGHIENIPEGDPHRTVHGTVEFRSEITLPADATVVVRVIDPAGLQQLRDSASKDLPLGDRAKVPPVPQVLAEQTITGAAGGSVPFSIDFVADDELLRHGLNLDARISSGGKVRFRTAAAHALTLGNLEYSHQVWVELAGR